MEMSMRKRKGLKDSQQVGDRSLCHRIAAGHRGQSETCRRQDVASLEASRPRLAGNQMQGGPGVRGNKENNNKEHVVYSFDMPGTVLGTFHIKPTNSVA